MTTLYSVVVTYEHHPVFSCTVFAVSEKNAENIGVDEARLKGWPKTFLSVKATKLRV